MASNGIFLSPGKFLSTCWKYKRNKTRNEITEKRETNEKKERTLVAHYTVTPLNDVLYHFLGKEKKI
jgi:hypothetical protein